MRTIRSQVLIVLAATSIAGSFIGCCEHHGMPATVRVHEGAPEMSASVGIQSSPRRFSPQLVEVQPGGTVTWTNGTSDVHTVTSN